MNAQKNLPKVGDILSTLKGYFIQPEETISEKGCAIRCALDEYNNWYIHNEHGGLVVILKPQPTAPFSRVKITGHSKAGSCVFGKPF